ncbi:conserved hypothetical protein [Theileria equi strain WA]|uniref:Uncharacterized protein n=1 Tax=Theileria equi strain WA TaxID=1537102 RepID=L1LC87_THEEQ|nr:conserved hypothetical protein [Theileria equi strain WA]EKX72894.1 conserved hypothetical protein [Theileria equi strain WA]|eukprot:XP_004832346.1 conserved hypothetical protein [Theileria equi strain WA]
MALNQYGGTFMGFKAIREHGIKKGVQEATLNKCKFPTSDDKPEKVIVTLLSIESLKLPELALPSKREVVVTAIFDDDTIEESLTHLRQSSQTVDATFLHDAYTANFSRAELVLPCSGKESLVLYVSCITTFHLEDGTKRIEFRGHGYTKNIALTNCSQWTQCKEELKTTDDEAVPGTKFSFEIVTTKEEFGPKIPDDVIGSVLDKYKKNDVV